MFYAKDCLKNFSEEQRVIKPLGRKSAAPEGKSRNVSSGSVTDRRDPLVRRVEGPEVSPRDECKACTCVAGGLRISWGRAFGVEKGQFPAVSNKRINVRGGVGGVEA